MALARYSQKAHARWKTAETKHAMVLQSLSRERKQRKQLQDDLGRARLQTIDDAAALAKSQAAVKKWERRMPVINELMAGIKPMTECVYQERVIRHGCLTVCRDMNMMRSKLTELGFDVPRRRYGFGDDPQGNAEDDIETQGHHDNGHARGMSISLAPRAETRAKQRRVVHEINDSSSSSRKRKRNHNETESGDVPHRPIGRNLQRMSSREMMPPPPPQIRQRNEMQSIAPTMPAAVTTQHHEIYHRSSNAPMPQHQTGSIGRSKRPTDDRAVDMSNPPIRLQPTNGNLAHHVYDPEMNDPSAFAEPAHFSMMDCHLESSPRMNQRPIVKQQAHIPQSSRPHSKDSNGRFMHTRDMAIEKHPQRPTRLPLRPVYANNTGLQTPKRISYPNVGRKPFVSPLRAGQPTAGSISSPFFQREASTAHIASKQRPPPHRGDMSQPYSQHDIQLAGNARSQWLHEPNGTSSVRDRFGLPTRENPLSDYGSFEPPPSTATLPFQGMTATSQIPGHSQPSYNSHAYASSMHPPVEKQFNPASRGRITLPPSKFSSQDYELSNIRALRGGYPQRAEGFPSQHHSGYNGSRPLFSAASRRSVRR